VALAGSVTQLGSTLGTAPGAPLPEGFYFSNTADWGVRDPSTRLLVDHPVYIWVDAVDDPRSQVSRPG
jgi:hypothetical protein